VNANNLLDVFPFLRRIRNWFRTSPTEEKKQNEEKEQPVNDIDQSKEKQLQQPLLPK
jgi:hypothetical protein